MKTKNFKVTAVAIMMAIGAMSIGFTSCKKDAQFEDMNGNNTSSTSSSYATMTPDGTSSIANFATQEAFNIQMDQLKSMDDNGLNDYNMNQTNYTSLYRQYQIMDQNAEEETGVSASYAQEAGTIVNIQDDYFASLVNKDGFLICANVIYKYSPEFYQSVALVDGSNIEDIDWNSQEQLSYKTYNYGNKNYASFSPNSRFHYQDNSSKDWNKSNNRKVRAVHTVWCSYYGVYSSIGAKVKMEKDSSVLGWINIEHSSACNVISSPIRKLKFQSQGGFDSQGNAAPGGTWTWQYSSISDTKNTTNKNVNQIVKEGSPVIGTKTQHEVNAFVSTISVTRGGQTKSSTWTN